MTAKEMFEELGYEYERNEYSINCETGSGGVHFNLEYKHYTIEDSVSILKLDIDLHKAITKQMQELGWI